MLVHESVCARVYKFCGFVCDKKSLFTVMVLFSAFKFSPLVCLVIFLSTFFFSLIHSCPPSSLQSSSSLSSCTLVFVCVYIWYFFIVLFSLSLFTSFSYSFTSYSSHLVSWALCLRLFTIKFIFTHIKVCLCTPKLEAFYSIFTVFDSTHRKLRWHTTHRFLSMENEKKKAQFFCVYMLPLLNSHLLFALTRWCEFMWWITTNQILKAGVKKITVMGARERKKENWAATAEN